MYCFVFLYGISLFGCEVDPLEYRLLSYWRLLVYFIRHFLFCVLHTDIKTVGSSVVWSQHKTCPFSGQISTKMHSYEQFEIVSYFDMFGNMVKWSMWYIRLMSAFENRFISYCRLVYFIRPFLVLRTCITTVGFLVVWSNIKNVST